MRSKLERPVTLLKKPLDHKTTWGYLSVVCAALCWGLSGSGAKVLFEQGMGPFELVQLRLGLSAPLLLFIYIFKKKKWPMINRQDLFSIFLLAILGLSANQYTYLLGISKMSVGPAILIEYLSPLLVVIFAVLLGKQKWDSLLFLKIICILFGLSLVLGVWGRSGLTITGVMAAFFSALTFCFYTLFGSTLLKKYDSFLLFFYVSLIGGIAWNLINPLAFFQKDYVTTQSLLWVLYIVTFGTCLPFILYYQGIKYIGPTKANVLAVLEPLFAGLFAFIWLDETPNIWQIMGAITVLSGIIGIIIHRPAKHLL